MGRAAAGNGPALRPLCTLLLFRLTLGSGLVKLLSGDPTWRTLTALGFHYETQPLPTWIGWYAHHLPGNVHVATAAVMFFVELVAPFFIFGPRQVRRVAVGAMAGLQVAIALTGNYGFFNLLTVALCLLALDDEDLLAGCGGGSLRPIRHRPGPHPRDGFGRRRPWPWRSSAS